MPASLDNAAARAAGYPQPLNLAPLTARFAACLATHRDMRSLPAIADELVAVLERYVAETPPGQLDQRLARSIAAAVGKAIDLIDQRERAKLAASAPTRRFVRRTYADDANEAFVIADPDLDQLSLEHAGVSLPERVGTLLVGIRS